VRESQQFMGFIIGHFVNSHMLKGILAMEEEHADDLADLLQGLPVK